MRFMSAESSHVSSASHPPSLLLLLAPGASAAPAPLLLSPAAAAAAAAAQPTRCPATPPHAEPRTLAPTPQGHPHPMRPGCCATPPPGASPAGRSGAAPAAPPAPWAASPAGQQRRPTHSRGQQTAAHAWLAAAVVCTAALSPSLRRAAPDDRATQFRRCQCSAAGWGLRSPLLRPPARTTSPLQPTRARTTRISPSQPTPGRTAEPLQPTSQDTKARSSISGCHWVMSMDRSLMPGAAGGVSRASSTTAGERQRAQRCLATVSTCRGGCCWEAVGGALGASCGSAYRCQQQRWQQLAVRKAATRRPRLVTTPTSPARPHPYSRP